MMWCAATPQPGHVYNAAIALCLGIENRIAEIPLKIAEFPFWEWRKI